MCMATLVRVWARSAQRADRRSRALRPTVRAHIGGGEPHVGQAAVSVEGAHGFGAHVLGLVPAAAVAVADHVPLRLEVHHRRDPQLLLQLHRHVLHLPGAAAQPNPGEDPERGGATLGQEVRAVVWQSEGCRFDPTLGVSKSP